MSIAIRAANLGKSYRIQGPGGRASYRTLREALGDLSRAPARALAGGRGKLRAEEFWALKEVDFEVRTGEVIGIIGHNGAGKSTLLKVLSQITRPTTGRVEIRGRIGSLLEVGTGFHPELTGRENILLNGSILGMSRREILGKFDEIVDFSGVARFLDTPVKRYSSGMYVRLAFSVSVHLNSEILLIDEILAVGDASFQQQCFKKMESISRQGRTILFVSHNLSIIRNLCNTAITLSSGRVVANGPAHEQVNSYLRALATRSRIDLAARTDREGLGRVRLTSLRFENEEGKPTTGIFPGESIRIVIGYDGSRTGELPVLALSCFNFEGVKIFHVDNITSGHHLCVMESRGEYTCTIPALPLTPGTYRFNAMISVDRDVEDHIFSAASLEILAGDFYSTGRTTDVQGSIIFLENRWDSRDSIRSSV